VKTTPAHRAACLRLARSEGVGPVTYRRLLETYRTPDAALEALPERARRAGRATTPTIPSLDAIETELHKTEALGGRVLLLGEPDYPPLLATLPDAPPALGILGNPARLSCRAVGIVGARNASASGLRLAESLATELTHAEICVISGLARGIDASAHRAALHTGRTAAAIAGGLDTIYPPEHATLQAEIAEKGCLVTEAPLGTIPQARHFPRRNRLIAGIALGCVIIEAAKRSGTLITADMALRYNRILYATPGSPLDPRSHGGNDLIRNGAILTETAADILRELPPYPFDKKHENFAFQTFPTPVIPGFSEPPHPFGHTPRTDWPDLDAALDHVRSLLSHAPVSVDEVMRRCQFSTSAVLTVLTELELGGVVEFLPGGQVALLPT